MRRAILCALALAAGLVTANLAWADDAPTGATWFSRLFQGGKSAKEASESRAGSVSDGPSRAGSVSDGPSRAVIEAKNAPSPRAQAEADYVRRFDICLKLEEIAVSTNDENLHRKVDLLRQRISEAYSRRTAYLPASSPTSVDRAP